MAVFDSLQVFSGEANPVRARIYVRAARPPEGERWRLSGHVTGPQSTAGATLPATVPLRDLGPGPTLLAEAVLPDPCFWSPKLPALYDVKVNLLDQQGQPQETIQREWGVRALGTRGADFRWEGRRRVLRGVERDCDPAAPLEAWRETSAAMIVASPDETLCREASQLGVAMAAWLSGDRREVDNELRRVARFAAVFVAVIDCRERLDETIAETAPNVLLGQSFTPAEKVQPATWANFAFVEVEQTAAFAERVSAVRGKLPVVAVRSLDVSGLQDARAQCDRLQRDLAPLGDFAGYCVRRKL